MGASRRGRQLSQQQPNRLALQPALCLAARRPACTRSLKHPSCTPPFLQHCAHKYLLHLAGVSNSDRLRYLLLCGSPVVWLRHGAKPFFDEFFYHLLQARQQEPALSDCLLRAACINTADGAPCKPLPLPRRTAPTCGSWRCQRGRCRAPQSGCCAWCCACGSATQVGWAAGRGRQRLGGGCGGWRAGKLGVALREVTSHPSLPPAPLRRRASAGRRWARAGDPRPGPALRAAVLEAPA